MMVLQNDVNEIKRILLREEPPEHFSFKDVARSFFGALFLGFAMLSKLLVDVASNLNIWLIVVFTSLILTTEIYFIGFARLKYQERKTRYFAEFWAKRFFTFYIVAIAVSAMLIWLYTINTLVPQDGMISLVLALSMPCAIGAASADLLRKY
jgi:uncharacterized membrane protein